MEENKQYKEPERQAAADGVEDDLQIDWMELLQKVIAVRKTLYKAAGIGLILGVIVALSIPPTYTVHVTLAPEMGGDSKSSGGLASLASSFLGGGALSGGADALNASLSSDIVASTPFVLDLFTVRVQDLEGEIDTALVDYLDVQRSPWWGYVAGLPGMAIGGIKSLFEEPAAPAAHLNPFQLTKEEAEKVKTLKEAIFASVDKKTAMTTVSVTLQDPKVTAIVADSVVNKLQQYIIRYRIAKAKEDCAYLEQLCQERRTEYYQAQEKYANYVDANKNVILQSVRAEQERLQNDMNLAFQVYSQVAQQLELSRAKIQEAKPVFAVVEPATVPLRPSSTGRKVIVLGVVFLTVCATAGWLLFGKEYWDGFKKKLAE